MQNVDIYYDPYKMKTSLFVEGVNIVNEPDYSEIGYFIKNKIPLQTWIEPIPYMDWNGILAALKSDDCEDYISFDFYGRRIDFDDFHRACENQNNERKYKLKLKFEHHDIRSDVETAKNIEEVKNMLLSKEFAEIMAEYPKNSEKVIEYQKIENKYNRAKNNEFQVVFAGLYSSGKSMIINTLIHHDVLPVSDETCTAKVCRIKHDSNLSDTVTLECFDKNGNSVIERREFDNDKKCLNYFNEIVPLNSSKKEIHEFDIIEIRANISHLYPSKEMEREFILTIIDTPGTNSSMTRGVSDNIDNLDKQITINAITGSNKDMVVICMDAQNYENESLGNLLREIQEVSEEDKGSFSDRFLFVVNKCDLLKYKSSENVKYHKDRFSKYLMDKKRWGIKEEYSKVEFVPRIFMTSAYIEYAIQKGVAEFKKNDCRDQEKRLMRNAYRSFMEEVIEYDNPNYKLSQVCDIPEYRKQEFSSQLRQLVNENYIPESISIQSGIPCIESTIRDYIERYAFPFKVRDLLESFEILLDVVNNDINYKAERCKIVKNNQKKKGLQIKEVKEENDEAKKRKEKNEKIKKEINVAREKMENIKIGGLKEIAEVIDLKFERNDDILKIRASFDKPQPKAKVDEWVEIVKNLIADYINMAEKHFSSFEQCYKMQITEILENLKSVCKDEFRGEGYNFQSITMSNIENLDINKLREEIQATKETRMFLEPNPIKQQTYKKYQIFKRLRQWLAPDFSEVSKDCYSVEPLLTATTDTLYEIHTFCDETEDKYSEDLDSIKNIAVEKINTLDHEIDEEDGRISEFESTLNKLSTDSKQLVAEFSKLQAQSKILHELKNKLMFGGTADV